MQIIRTRGIVSLLPSGVLVAAESVRVGVGSRLAQALRSDARLAGLEATGASGRVLASAVALAALLESPESQIAGMRPNVARWWSKNYEPLKNNARCWAAGPCGLVGNERACGGAECGARLPEVPSGWDS